SHWHLLNNGRIAAAATAPEKPHLGVGIEETKGRRVRPDSDIADALRVPQSLESRARRCPAWLVCLLRSLLELQLASMKHDVRAPPQPLLVFGVAEITDGVPIRARHDRGFPREESL